MSFTEFGRQSDPSLPVVPPARQAPAARRRSRFTWHRALGLGALVILLAVAGYGVRLGWSLINLTSVIYHPDPPTPLDDPNAPVWSEVPLTPEPTVGPGTPTRVPRPRTPVPPITPTPWPTLPPGRVNILLLGTDKRANDPGTTARSDTIILFTVDTVKKTVGMLNIPRDLVMTVPQYGKRRVNAAYAIGEYNGLPGGGAFVAVQTIQHFLGVPIKYYMAVNFEGFQKVVDTVGGIYINVPEEIDDTCYPTAWYGCEHVHFNPGYQFMDGETALKYARTRHSDSDFGRSRRQQQVILAVRQQALRMNMLPRLPDLIDQLGGMVETNIPFDTEMSFAQLASSLQATDIYTAQIDSHYVYDVPDPFDGSPGALGLDWKAAQPLLDEFFGRGLAANTVLGARPTPGKGTSVPRTPPVTPLVLPPDWTPIPHSRR